MKRANTNLALFCISLMLGLFHSAAVFSQDTAGQLLARINKLTPEKRRDLVSRKGQDGRRSNVL